MSITNIIIFFFIYIVIEKDVRVIFAKNSVSEVGVQTLGNNLLRIVL